MIIVGERDAECPAPQSFEFWRGLQHVGVKTQLVVYPDEGHQFENPAHKRDLLAAHGSVVRHVPQTRSCAVILRFLVDSTIVILLGTGTPVPDPNAAGPATAVVVGMVYSLLTQELA